MKKCTFLFLFLVAFGAFSQINAQGFEEWKKQQQKERQEFYAKEKAAFQKMVEERNQAIKQMDNEFKEFLKKEWSNYKLSAGEVRKPEPKPEETPVFKQEQSSTVEMTIEIPEPVESGSEAPRLPVLAPNINKDINLEQRQFAFYGAQLNIRFDNTTVKSITNQISEEQIAEKWEELSKTDYNTLLKQLFSYKSDMNLNDWGYYLLVKKASKAITSTDNASVLLEWFLLTKSNYKARLAYKGNQLFLLLPSSNNIYGIPYFTFDNLRYYLVNGKENDVFTYDKDFPEARIIMDLNLYKSINTEVQLKSKTVSFNFEGKDYSFDVSYNQNAINFYKDYPLADIEVYFDATITPQTKASLSDALIPLIKGKPEEQAVDLILSFVQKAFEYKTDQDQFGNEKFFFPDELFSYPYSDCEDRSVLFSYLVKELIGLDVVGLNYPGHMATAVKFTKEVPGSYIMYKGDKYTVCDPTYVNAPIGQTMPQYAQSNALIVELKSPASEISRGRAIWRIANKKGLYQGGNSKNIAFDQDGNAYICGYFNQPTDFFGHKLTPSSGSNDIFIAKIANDNAIEYAFRIGSSGNDIAYSITMGKDNSFYFTGSFNKDISFGNQTLKVQNNGDFFIAKCSLDGKLKWVNQAGIEQLDSLNNMFVAHFDENGQKLWTRVYEESEDYSNYGITVDDQGKTYITASLLASAEMSVDKQSYESYASFDAIEMIKTEHEKLLEMNYEKGVSGLFAVLHLVNGSGTSLPGNQAQQALDKYNPTFKKKSPTIYENIGKIEFIKNSQGIVTIRTDDGEDVNFDAVRVRNNSKIKVQLYNSGNAQINVLNGISVGKAIIWYDLNYIKVFKDSGNLVFDYDSDHTQKEVNMTKDILF